MEDRKDWPKGVVARFTSKEGIHFDSYTPTWGYNDLRRLYLAFMQNAHGEELSMLAYVNLRPDLTNEAGNFDAEWTEVEGKATALQPGRTINIFHADELTGVNQAISVLTHEYGHLFTYYWIIKGEQKAPDLPTTKWASIRKLEGLPIAFRGSDNPDVHFWRPEEIMADDYVMLFGTPAAKYKLFPAAEDKYDTSYSGIMENIAVPAPESIPGLRAYWENLSGVKSQAETLKAPVITKIKPVVSKTRFGEEVQYEIHFSPASQDPAVQNRLRYFVQWNTRTAASQLTNAKENSPVVPHGSPVVFAPQEYRYEAFLGKRSKNNKAFFRVYAIDDVTGQLIWGPMAWYDFTKRDQPKPIPDQFQTK